MVNLQRHSLILMMGGILLVFILFGLLIPSPVQADVGVRPILPGGSNIQPEGETPIQMSAEIVTMNVRSATEADNVIIQLNPEAYGFQFQPVWYAFVAEVQADFTMHNPTSDGVSLTAWFPLASALESVSWELNPDEIVPRIASFHVAVDGDPIDYSVSELPNPKGADKPLLPWASFPVSFSAGGETMIQVSYLLPLQSSVKGSELALYYIFQTGAGWAGPIGRAELILNLPYPASAETLARMSSSNLSLPYFMSNPQSVIPFDGVMERNQASWTWTDFEPLPKDDFSIWLVDPGIWQDLENARAAVQASPEDGHAWLSLASVYRTLATRAYNYPSIFGESFLSLGLEAYRNAAELLPEHPAPHTGMALLSLAPYMPGTNAPSEVMGFVQSELQTARDLEALHPDLVEEGGISSWLLEDALGVYYYDITATAEFDASSTAWANATEAAAKLLTPSVTPTPPPSLTPTIIPSLVPSPLPSTLATPEIAHPDSVLGNGQGQVIIVTVGVIILVIVGYLVFKKLRGNSL